MRKSIAGLGSVRAAGMFLGGALLAAAATPSAAQDTADSRLRKVEAEVRALQRKVFPGSDGKYFEPEITPATGATAGAGASRPSTTAVTDILTRMDALETQVARMTGQIEQNSNRLTALERAAGIATGTSVPATTPPASSAAAVTPAPTPAPAPAPPPAAQSNLNAMTGGASAAKPPAATAASAAATASAARTAAVSAVIKPQTDDPGDDEYSYGFRLWESKFYPEAAQQLKLFIEKYPQHKRVSWGRNLLGRAYLDQGQPREAAKWFLQNYQANKAGDRAPDSLLYLAVSMKRQNDSKRACIALAEFAQTYAAEAAGRLKNLYDSTRTGLACS